MGLEELVQLYIEYRLGIEIFGGVIVAIFFVIILIKEWWE